VDPGSPGLSEVHIEECADAVNGNGVVNVYDNGQVGCRLGEGEHVVDDGRGSKRGVVGPDGAERVWVEGGKDMVAEAKGGEEGRADKVDSGNDVLL